MRLQKLLLQLTESGEDNDFTWFATTLRQYPEIAIFLVLALGYYFGKFTFRGIGLGSVTATLLAGVLIGQLGITISPPLKATVFLMFLFAVGYGVGPQFVRGVAKDGLPQAIFSAVQCIFCLAVPVVIAQDGRAMTWVTPRVSTPGHRQSPPPWASPPMLSTDSGFRQKKPSACSTQCRSPMP